jgi:DNA end-binding protein Ku
MLDLAAHIIEMKMAKFDPARFKDWYQEAVADLIRSKQAGRPVAAPHTLKPAKVINLMDALRRSLGERKTKAEPEGGKEAALQACKSSQGAAARHG